MVPFWYLHLMEENTEDVFKFWVVFIHLLNIRLMFSVKIILLNHSQGIVVSFNDLMDFQDWYVHFIHYDHYDLL